MISIQLPDGSRREYPGPVTVEEVAASIGPGLAKAALGGRIGAGQASARRRHELSHRSRRAARDRHRQGRRRPRAHPPFDGAPARLCGQGAVSRRAGDDRPGHRERLLLRLRVQAPVHARGPRGDRGEDGRAREEGRAGRRAGSCRATRRSRISRRWARPTRRRSSPSIPAGRGRLALPRGAFEDLCRGPHVPSTRQAQALQADEGGRRLLARRLERTRCCSASTARPGRPRTSCSGTCTCSRRPRSATTASSAASSTCSTSTRSRRAWCSGTRRAGRSGRQVEQYMRQRLPRHRLPGGQGARRSSTRACGRRPATGRTTARTCSRRSRRSASTRSSR